MVNTPRTDRHGVSADKETSSALNAPLSDIHRPPSFQDTSPTASAAGRLVAVKMTAFKSGSRPIHTEFEHEVRVLRHIASYKDAHPSLPALLRVLSVSTLIPTLYSSTAVPSAHALLLPFTPGGDLLELVNSDTRHGLLTDALMRSLWTELAGAVAWLHRKGVVHRDVKLENILLTSTPFPPPPGSALPKGPLINLTDFGLARVVYETKADAKKDEKKTEENLFMLTTRCGSESYLAPELVIAATPSSSLSSHQISSSHSLSAHDTSSPSFYDHLRQLEDIFSSSDSSSSSHSDSSPRKDYSVPYDARKTDAWACGVVLYALMTRELPFGEEIEQVESNIAYDGHEDVFNRKRGRGGRKEKRQAWLGKIARADWAWPTGDSIQGSNVARLVESPWARDIVERLMVREPSKRAAIGDCL
ncbi:hypothetical protein SERLADRAFT_417315 [Serpula lacrymans var. lacrymans S7.9]|nr:uncharacterized protein SERLADRAFT_417315 [Serpula lacrymans var. lacrymans S7.9]EGO21918.1 hypothetical protein SERLADRAFT_417315 [Serpula lacrymans var. lacrymans S7.9]